MQSLKQKIKAFGDNAEALLRWAAKEKKKNPEAEDIAEEMILTAYDKLVDAGAESLLIASGFEELIGKRRSK